MKTITNTIIEVSGFTEKNCTALWDGSHIITATSFDAIDFDFGDKNEEELEACKKYIAKKVETEGWLEGKVVPYLSEYTYEIEE